MVLYQNDQKLAVLNPTAHFLWRVLARGEQACLPAALASRFGLSREMARSDAAAAIDGWIAQGLVSDAAGNLPPPDKQSARGAAEPKEKSETRRFRLAGLTIALDAPVGIAHRLASLGTAADASESTAQIACTFETSPAGLGSLIVNGEVLLSLEPAEVLIGAFYERLIGHLRPGVTWLAMIHAGAVSLRGRAAILAAPSGSGKSTLVAWLAAQGFDYLADDLVPLRADDHAIAPFPMPIGIKPGSIAALAPYRPLDVNSADGEQFLFHDVSFDGPCHPATALVFPRYSATAPARCSAVSVQDALVSLLSDRIHFGAPMRAENLGQFVRWLRDITIYELVYSDFDDAKRWMTDILTP